MDILPIPAQLMQRAARFQVAQNTALYDKLLKLWKKEDKSPFYQELQNANKDLAWLLRWKESHIPKK